MSTSKPTETWLDICTTLFTTTLFTKARKWKQPKCPLRNEWWNKPRSSHSPIGEYYAAIKKNDMLTQAKTWMQLENNAQWKTPVTKEHTLDDCTYVRFLESSDSWRQKGWWLPGTGGSEELFNGYKVSVWKDKKVLEVDDGNVYTTSMY